MITFFKNFGVLNFFGGPYRINFNEEPDHDDVEAQLYWNSFHEIVKIFIKYSSNIQNLSRIKIVSLIKMVFDILKNFNDLPDSPNLSNVLIKYINNLFNNFSNQRCEKISEEIKKDFKKYDNRTINKLNTYIEENLFEVYQNLIPYKIKNFMEKSILKLRNEIEIQFEKEFEIKCKEITSDEFINNCIINIKNEINKANFKEDINMNIDNKYTEIWNIVEKENEKLFLYFLNKKPFEILKKNFNNSMENITLISNKIVWKDFFEDKKRLIHNEINKKYLELFRKIQYQEDFYKKIIPSEQLSKEIFEKLIKLFLKNYQMKKKNEIYNWIKKIVMKLIIN